MEKLISKESVNYSGKHQSGSTNTIIPGAALMASSDQNDLAEEKNLKKKIQPKMQNFFKKAAN